MAGGQKPFSSLKYAFFENELIDCLIGDSYIECQPKLKITDRSKSYNFGFIDGDFNVITEGWFIIPTESTPNFP